ncbi:AN1-type zinc finger protein 2B-like isoform X2 [Watersipora subatra]|uniref:AN1-type zinc finger protein 2B-like isoform X2 n=1 Tax=Watersipora subatra TaxID=2589382 RepID=UPI00355C3AC7
MQATSKDHIQYSSHSCSESYKKDKQVPVCPLCNKPIPLKPGEVADVKVGAHIDADCQSDPAKERRKVYTNRCSKKGCKVKEMVSVRCDRCSKNYCLKHRHENDHECTGSRSNSPASARSMAASAASMRSKQQTETKQPTRSGGTVPQQSLLNSIGSTLAQDRQSRNAGRAVPVGNFQAGLTEDEALQQALQLSAAQAPTHTGRPMTQQEKDDEALAKAIAASESETRQGQSGRARSSQSSCSIN